MPSFTMIHAIVIFTFLTSCSISSLLNLSEKPPVFSTDIILPNLTSEFKKQTESVFPSWKNKKTSNVISVFSDCTDTTQNLKSVHSTITNSIENETVVEAKKVSINNNEGYFRKVYGQIDGHDIEIISSSFKYKNCVYLSSLSGQRTKINSDLNSWQIFNQNIEFKK